MAKNSAPIYWLPELTVEAEELSAEFLADIFAPIIQSRLAASADEQSNNPE
ncbi:hypothetical protein [Butyricicoccus sp.]|uniref:hypothetical protein n=1 Tax=Butyricicoccus sp. TaxID=2049021 RepID=UPI003D7D2B87